jgi:hypothetical protein
MPNIPAPRQPEEPPVRHICPLKDTLTEANITTSHPTFRIQLERSLSTRQSYPGTPVSLRIWLLMELCEPKFESSSSREAIRIHLFAKDLPSIGTGENTLDI